MRGLLVLCFFISGAAGLLFEVIWVRHLTLSLGHTTLAISVVLSAFMTGLAIGGYVGGEKADALTTRKLIQWYIACEMGIGLLGLFSHVLINSTTHAVPLIDLKFSSSLFKHTIWFFLSFLPLLAPTVLMGATLPLMSRWLFLESQSDSGGRSLGLAYGANTLGAVAGTMAAGFFLIPLLGLTKCYVAAALLNFSAAGLAYLALIQTPSTPLRPTKNISLEFPRKKEALLLLFLTGTAAMICQVAWTRLFSLVIGSSTYAFSMILLVFLIGLAVGSLLFRSIHRLFEPEWSNLWVLFLFLGLGVLAYLPMFNKLPYYFSELFQYTRGPNSLFLVQFLLCLIVMFLPTLIMGLVLPWTFEALSINQAAFGRMLGVAYLANTTGAIVGSALTGLILVPFWGAEKSIVVAAWLYAAALLIVVVFDKQTLAARRTKIGVSAFLIFVLATGLKPPLDPAVMSSGAFIYAPDYSRKDSYQDFLSDVRANRILFHEDGVSSTITVLETNWGIRFLRVNGKTDASSTSDMTTQLLQGYLARLLHSGTPKNALVIGLGSGVTVGALASDAQIEKIDCVEIEPAMKKILPYFKNVNRDIAEDPRFHFIPTDGRHYLEATSQSYDVISSEPSNPWIAGVSNLFTREAFQTIKNKLADDGVFCQWFHSYSMGLDDFTMVLNTFADVFPHVILFTSGEKDYFLLGSKKPWNIEYAHLENLFDSNPVMVGDLTLIGLNHPFTLLASTFLLDDADFRTFAENSPIHRDDKPTLEFSAPRFLHRGEDRLILESIMAAKKEFLPKGFKGLVTDNKGWALLYNMAGESFMRLRHTEQANLAFSKAMSKNPMDPRSWVNLGRIQLTKNEFIKAEQSFRKALAMNPHYALGHFHLGMLYLDQGLEEEGLRSLERGLKASPGDPMGALQVAQLYSKRGRKEEARKVVENALQYPIKNVDIYNGLIQFLSSLKEKPAQKI